MAEIIWTEQALDDIDAIASYIARDSLYYAKIHTQRIFEAVRRLESFPKSGRVVPELNDPQIREVILGNYRIIYRHRSNLVEIITIHHSSRQFNTKLFNKIN